MSKGRAHQERPVIRRVSKKWDLAYSTGLGSPGSQIQTGQLEQYGAGINSVYPSFHISMLFSFIALDFPLNYNYPSFNSSALVQKKCQRHVDESCF